MDFRETLQQTIAPLSKTIEDTEEMQTHEESVIAQCAPHVLRRLAEIASAFDAPGMHAGHGEILACRRGSEGYRTVSYEAPELTIRLNAADGRAHLTWRVGDATGDRHLTLETPEAAIDAILLEAVSAFVNGRVAQASS